MGAYVYILRCNDGRYYVGSTRAGLERRVAQHNDGTYGGFTRSRRPVELVYYEEFERIGDTIAAERRLKGWSRAKKEALMRRDLEALKRLARRGSRTASSFDTPTLSAPQDEAVNAEPLPQEALKAVSRSTGQ